MLLEVYAADAVSVPLGGYIALMSAARVGDTVAVAHR